MQNCSATNVIGKRRCVLARADAKNSETDYVGIDFGMVMAPVQPRFAKLYFGPALTTIVTFALGLGSPFLVNCNSINGLG